MSSVWGHCVRATRSEVLRLEIEAARSGLEAADRSAELERLAVTGEVVFVGGRRRRWFTPGLLDEARAAFDGRRRGRPAPAHCGRTGAQRQAGRRGGGRGAGGASRRRSPGNAVTEATCVPGPRPRPTRWSRSCFRRWRAMACSPGRSWHLAPGRAWRRRRRVRRWTGWWHGVRSCGRSRASTTTRMPWSGQGLEVVALCEQEGAVTIARLRDRLATGRKHSPALLEHLDATPVTRRVADEHVLRRSK